MRRHATFFFVILSGLVLVPAVSLHAQSGVGTVRVVVQDESGAPLSGAEIKLMQRDTNYFRDGQTNKKGKTIFRFVNYGSYIVVVLLDQHKVLHISYENTNVPSQAAKSSMLAKGRKLSDSSDIGLSQQMLPFFLGPAFEVTYTITMVLDDRFSELRSSQLAAVTIKAATNDTTGDANIQLAMMALKKGDHDSAITETQKSIDKNASADKYMFLGNIYKDSGQTENALKAFKQASRMEANPNPWLQMASLHMTAEDYASATSAFQSALEIDPANNTALHGLATSGEKSGNAEVSIAALENLIKLHPEETSYYDNLIDLYNRQNNTAKAQKVFTRKRSLSGAGSDAGASEASATDLFNEGVIALNNRNESAAVKAFQKAIQIDPDYSKPYFQLGKLAINRMDCPKVIEYYSKFLELAPNDPEASTAQQLVDYCKTQ